MNWKWPILCLAAAAAYALFLFLGVDATWVRPRDFTARAADPAPSASVTLAATRPGVTVAPATSPAAGPFAEFTRAWRDDPIWTNGNTEVATYEVTRTIAGAPRTDQARVMTRRGFADPVTKTISAAADPLAAGHREVFIQQWREAIPADDDARQFSTTIFVGAQDLKSLKIDMAMLDDHGATFKQFVNHKGTLTWQQYSGLAGQGGQSGAYSPPGDMVFLNALPLALRGFPFDDPVKDIKISLLTDQASPQLTPADPQPAHIIYAGRMMLELPIGKIDAHHVVLVGDKASRGVGDRRFWFAADGKPPMLHVMVQHQSNDGTVHRLKSLERRAYLGATNPGPAR